MNCVDEMIVNANSNFPEVRVSRSMAGNLVIDQVYKYPGGSISRCVVAIDASRAVELAHKILEEADKAFLNPVQPLKHLLK